MRWGIERADRDGLECVVEAGLRAESYYATWGFKAREMCRFEVPTDEERWKGKGVQEYVWMVRPAKTSSR